MHNATLDLAILLVVFLIAYFRPCARFFNTLIGRFILLACIVLLSTASTLWGILGVIVLVSLREKVMEGMENMKQESDEDDDSDDSSEVDDSAKVEDSTDDKVKKVNDTKKDSQNVKPKPKSQSQSQAQPKPEDWRKKNCKADQVMLNGEAVNMSEFEKKFPDVKFLSGKCNPCLADCNISITSSAARLEAEDKVRSKSSNSLPVQ